MVSSKSYITLKHSTSLFHQTLNPWCSQPYIYIASVTHMLLIVSCSRGLSGLFHVHIHTDTPSCCGLMTLIQVKWIGLSQPWIASKLSESLVSSPRLQCHWLTLMPSLRTHRGHTHTNACMRWKPY